MLGTAYSFSGLPFCANAGMIAQARRYISTATPSTPPPHPPLHPEANGDGHSSLALSMRPTPSPGIPPPPQPPHVDSTLLAVLSHRVSSGHSVHPGAVMHTASHLCLQLIMSSTVSYAKHILDSHRVLILLGIAACNSITAFGHGIRLCSATALCLHCDRCRTAAVREWCPVTC